MKRPTSASRRLDVEWIAMREGVKPANRVSVPPERAAEVETMARREGFAVARSADIVEFPGRAPSTILYLARDDAKARELAEAEAPLLPPKNANLPLEEELTFHRQLGRLLGFPACCVEEFATRLRRGITRRLDGRPGDEDFVAAECASRASRRFLGRLNDLSPDRHVRIVTFYPCRYDCPAASEYAAAVFRGALKLDPVAARALHDALLGAMFIAVDGTRGAAAVGLEETLRVDFDKF